MDEATRSFHRFTKPPFGPVVSPGEAFLAHARIDVAISIVERTRDEGNVLAVLRGAPGSGKTVFALLLATMLQESSLPTAQIPPDERSPMQIHSRIAALGGLTDGIMEPGAMLQALCVERGLRRLVVLVDDADSLPAESFRYLWQLLEFRVLEATQVHLVLLGQPGRWEGVQAPDLERLRNAVCGGYMMRGLSDRDAAAYLSHRLQLAGRPVNSVVSRAARDEVIARSRGVPGRMNELMDAAFAAAHRAGHRRITPKHLQQPVTPEAERRGGLSGVMRKASYWRPASIVIGSLAASACVAAALVKLGSASHPAAHVSPSHRFTVLAGKPFALSPLLPMSPSPEVVNSASNDMELGGISLRPSASLAESSPLASRLSRMIVPAGGDSAPSYVALSSAELRPLPPPPTPWPLAPRLARLTVMPTVSETAPSFVDLSGIDLRPLPSPPKVLLLAPRVARLTVEPVPEAVVTTYVALAGTDLRPAAPAPKPQVLSPKLGALKVEPTLPAMVEPVPSSVVLAGLALRPAAPLPKPSLAPTFTQQTLAPAPPQPNSQSAPPTRPAPPGLAFLAGPGDSLQSLYVRIYHGVTPPPFSVFAAANPVPVQAGNIVFFPEPPSGWAQQTSGGH